MIQLSFQIIMSSLISFAIIGLISWEMELCTIYFVIMLALPEPDTINYEACQPYRKPCATMLLESALPSHSVASTILQCY